MPKEPSMDRKNIYRRQESQRVRVDRIISGYVKHRHPEVFKEANDYYQWLNELYPEKKDLRRCNEFEILKHGTDSPIRKFYTTKKKITHATVSPKSNISDTMVLQIPLMKECDIVNQTIQTAETPTCANEITVETTVESETVVVESSSQPETVVETPMPSISFTELPPVSDEMLEQIISGLREDPDICTFFDDIEFQLDDCPLW